MDSTTKKHVRGVRLTPKRTPEEQRRLNKELLEALHETQDEARRNGMTPAKARAIIRELYKERRERRRAR